MTDPGAPAPLQVPSLLGEDPDWLFVVKPAGLPVFPPHDPGAGTQSVLSWLLEMRPEQGRPRWEVGFEGGITHRLDTATSGLLLVARGQEPFARARGLFAAGALRKRYLFLTTGRVAWRDHTVEVELAHHERDRRKMIPRRGRATPHRGKWYPARSHLRWRAEVGGGVSLWEVVIETGVTHQIRVHAAWVGLPLLGDRLYGGAPSPGPCPGAAFWLHHQQMEGPGLRTPAAPLPPGWPVS